MQPIRHWIIATILIGTLAASACGDDKPTTPTAPTPSTTTLTPPPPTPTTPTATSLAIEGPSELEVGKTVQYQAMVTYSDGETKRVTDDVEWVSGNTTVATVDSAGRVTGRRAGGFDLRATAEGVTGRMTGIRVEPPTATSLAIEGPSELEVGKTVQYQAMVTYSDGETKRVTDDVEWVSGNTTVATVDSAGRVTGRWAGGFDLRATAEGVTGRMTGIRVEPEPEQWFNKTFWGRLIYNAYEKPDGLTGRVSWVMPTTSPNVYIWTRNVDSSALAYMRREIPRIVEAVTGRPYSGRVDYGPNDRESIGWITIRVVTVDEEPEEMRGQGYCGYAYIGADPGRVWISPWASGCDGIYPARMLAHELGHALGLYHVPDADAVMKQYARTTAFSAAEQHHATLAYERGRGTLYGDGSTFAPSRRGVVGRPVGVAD